MNVRAPIASAAARLRHVFVRDMVVRADIGVMAHEHGRAQRVRVNVDLGVTEPACGFQGSDLDEVLDYDEIAAAVRRVLTSGHVGLVETVAERIAEACLTDHRVALVRVRVEKLDVCADAASVGVEIERCAAMAQSFQPRLQRETLRA